MSLKQLFCRHSKEECHLCRSGNGLSFWLYICERCKRPRLARF